MHTQGELDIVQSSAYFDAHWYSQKYPDVLQSGLHPFDHYLRYGALLERDPSPLFCTRFYLEAYPDVAKSGMNPLVHYVLYGRDEGRVPHPTVHQGRSARRKMLDAIDEAIAKLWGGFSELALSILERYVHSPPGFDRLRACAAVASWKYVHGDVPAALELLVKGMEGVERWRRREAVMLSKCYARLADFDAIRDLLRDKDIRALMGPLLPYVEANSLAGHSIFDRARLDAINRLFIEKGLAPLQKRRAEDELSIGNIAANAVCGSSIQPKISIIVPVYNAEDSIAIALDGLLNQTWRNIEVIVVDDASTDRTADVVLEYAKKHRCIKFYRNTKNQGAYVARNRGFELSTGQFVTVHDGDDWSHPQKLELQMAALASNPEAICSVSFWVRVLPRLIFLGPWQLSDGFIEKNHSSALMHRDIVQKLGGWDSVNVGADTEFLWRLEAVYGKDAIVDVLPDVPLSFALVSESSLTRTSATHVKTIHYGLRWHYRDAAQWWHRHSIDKRMHRISEQLPFPVPIGNTNNATKAFDRLYVADFSLQSNEVDQALHLIAQYERSGGDRKALIHWPSAEGRHSGLDDRIYVICIKYGISIVNPGESVKASSIHLIGDRAFKHVPDNMPVVVGGAPVYWHKNEDEVLGPRFCADVWARISTWKEEEVEI